MISFSAEVKNALSNKQPVVALESTIIAHGMPYPRNVETAMLVEETIRRRGAIPATCAIIGGKLCAGLTSNELELVGKEGAAIPKASRSRIFATGGIGGVHRGATSTMDISADLQELAQTPVAVVSAGAKSILDLGLTLEYLETHGVPVIGFGTGEFPAFYTRRSGFTVDYRLDTPGEIASLLKVKWEMGLEGGAVIANPIPEEFQMDATLIENTIREAVLEAERTGIRGKRITPFLLARIEELTEGKSLESNIRLVLNNAGLAADISRLLEEK
ncbi:MAG: pseudouridine-5'-phosphate glycosidase [Saprospiraceae bacterium]|nr:pseudouridine-5'-phosphate glycosidase [Saprospiraceae bacterium]